MSRYNATRDTKPVLDAAQRWIRSCLIAGGSVLGDLSLWQLSTIDELVREFTGKPDESSLSFFDKLQRQMEPASADAKCLMAEMLWALMIFQSGTTPTTKREQVRRVWHWSGRPLNPPDAVFSDASLIGLGHPGIAYNAQRWRELNYMIGLAKDLQARSLTEREAILTSQDRFEAWIEAAPMQGDRQFASIFRYLAFPEFFEPITQKRDRKLILERLGGMDSTTFSDLSNKQIDRAIFDLRKKLEWEAKSDSVDFYASPLIGHWKNGSARQKPSAVFEDGYQKLRKLFLKTYPGFSSFVSDERYARDERSYKDELVELFRNDVLAKLEDSDWRNAGEAAIELLTKTLDSEAGPQNIVGWRYQSVLTELRDDQKGEFARDLASLINENEPLDSRIDHFVERLFAFAHGNAPPAAATTRSITGFYLALSDPTLHFFLKTREMQRAFRHVDPAFSWTPGRLTGLNVLKAEELANQLFDLLKQEDWGIRDLFDVQSFLWAAMRATGEVVAEEISEGEEDESMTPNQIGQSKPPLNQILFGPPGTGKTYQSINRALEILDPVLLQAHPGDSPDVRHVLKRRFDELVKDARIRFVTFHQSFSYEDFVEGLRADLDGEKGLNYRVEPGVFKSICDSARGSAQQAAAIGIKENARIWKISIDGTGPSPTRRYCFAHNEARIGWVEIGDLNDENFADRPGYQQLGSNGKNTLQAFSSEMQLGDVVLCISSATTIQAIGVVTGDYFHEVNVPKGVASNMGSVRPVQWLALDLDLDIRKLNDGTRFTLKTVYEISRFSWPELAGVIESAGIKLKGSSSPRKPLDHVLIIDEINRGNVSRIFGELITLIEPSKREGAFEQLEVVLPYSKTSFKVPASVYVIGTMNTADRSLTGLDIALRRRFNFVEMPADPSLLKGVSVEGVDIRLMLERINERIEVLLDRDHQLGHAYFMPLKDDRSLNKLSFIFRNQILPLLQEYFFEDWQRIQWVLNDHRKAKGHQFIVETGINMTALFGLVDELGGDTKRWKLDSGAFDQIESYRGIAGASASA